MKNVLFSWGRSLAGMLPYLTFISLFIFFYSVRGETQSSQRFVPGEMASCTINVSKIGKDGAITKEQEKAYTVHPNQMGAFDRVYIQPLQKVPVSINYPKGKPGDKVLIVVGDGGTLDDHLKTKVVALDKGKSLLFNFQAAGDVGIYRIMLRKGSDTKIVQLWVGPDPQTAQK